jgi:hypothetical protein
MEKVIQCKITEIFSDAIVDFEGLNSISTGRDRHFR